MTTVVIFVILLSLLVFVHELGHFLVAKLTGIRVEEFGIGFPPRALTLFKKGETQYTLNWLPIGGFVKLYGEEYAKGSSRSSAGSHPNEKGAFYAQSGWVKSAVLTAGVGMNYLLGLLLIMVVFWGVGVPKVNQVAVIKEVSPGSPAADAGLEEGDVILKVAGQPVEDAGQIVRLVNEHPGRKINFTLRERKPPAASDKLRPDEETGWREVTLVPRKNPPQGEGAVGITFTVVPEVSYHRVSWWRVPALATVESLRLVRLMVDGIGRILGDLITQGILPKDIAGPVGIAKITGEVAREGFYQLLQFAALLSINLAVINLLPFPALDGGRLIFVIAEGIAGRALAPKWQAWINIVGMLVLLVLMALITVYDVVRIF